MPIIEDKIRRYYEEFRGLPNNNPIVRFNQENDAFELVVLEALYKDEIGDINSSSECLSKICKYIVPPPDGGIDIVFEKEDGDVYSYEFVQVKNEPLPPDKIRACFQKMKESISDYLNKASGLPNNLLNVLNNTCLDSTSEDRIRYIVAHTGDTTDYDGIKNDCSVVGAEQIETLLIDQQLGKGTVTRGLLRIDNTNNFAVYNDAYLVNLNGYDLAELCLKYNSTNMGRNILFGGNLRESLEKKAKQFYQNIKETIDKTPEDFWYYNNGITIIAKNIKPSEEDKNTLELEKFTIINGAQTTSSLGKYLKENKKNEESLNKLKKVCVFARLLEVENDNKADLIAIYNNTQNPITTRDMVSNRNEQQELKRRLLENYPRIYMEIKRGQSCPDSIQFYKHRKTQNDKLAQLAFAGFLRSPYTAKDKKNKLFEKSFDDKYVINEYYDKVFNLPMDDDTSSKKGILQEKSNKDIDELLFVDALYRESNLKLKKEYDAQILRNNEQLINGELDKETTLRQNNIYKKSSEISNVCLFYVLMYYYYLKSQFGGKDFEYNYEEFYARNSEYKKNVIEAFKRQYLMKTISIIRDLVQEGNVPNWIRSKKSEDQFRNKLENIITDEMFTLREAVNNYEKTFGVREIVNV